MERVIFHIDMDAFFSSVEQNSNPNLKGKPVIICGDPFSRSVVSTASYEARKYGLKSGMPISKARRLCPHGIFITGNPGKYVYTSVKILGILREFTSKVEPFSVDEAFLEFNDLEVGESVPVAREIKRRISNGFDLSCSIGIGTNKIIAKMASELNKPDGLTVVNQSEFLRFFGEKNVSVLWGVGEKTSLKLRGIGISKVKELALFPEATLKNLFGEYGAYLKMTANGIDDSPVVPFYQGIDPKSIGHECTLASDSNDLCFLLSTLLRLSEQVGRRMRKEGFVCDTVTVKLRYKDFRTITRQKKLESFFDRDDILFETARVLFLNNFEGDKIRLIGVSASGLEKKAHIWIDPILSEDIRYDECVRAVDSIRDRFGEDSILKCGSIRPEPRSRDGKNHTDIRLP